MKKASLYLIFILFTFTVQAKVVLPGLISDNMVFQQESDVVLWGTTEPNTKVKITIWNGKKTSTVSDNSGVWKATVRTPSAGGPYKLHFDDGDIVTINNVMVGEVWFCSGQSNMVMRMQGYESQPVENAMDHVITASPSQPIRVCIVGPAATFEELSSCKAKWHENTPEEISNVSAIAYFYAKRLQETLKVPVGVIVSAWGGSKIEAWMPRKTLEGSFPEVDLSFLDSKSKVKKRGHAPTMLYNGMIAPLGNFMIKGVIWYQGCSNCENADLYQRLQPAFVQSLRDLFKNPVLPFYYVQIAPYKYSGYENTEAALLREAQLNASKEIPHSGMVVAMDCGDYECIHPARKKTVADRLAFLALQKTYGIGGIDAISPSYKSYEIIGNKVYIKFSKSIMGIGPKGHLLVGFEIAGEDKVFHPAKAHTGKDGNTVVVQSENVSTPVSVRYAFKNCSPISVYNTFGIPASPFRTDNWE